MLVTFKFNVPKYTYLFTDNTPINLEAGLLDITPPVIQNKKDKIDNHEHVLLEEQLTITKISCKHPKSLSLSDLTVDIGEDELKTCSKRPASVPRASKTFDFCEQVSPLFAAGFYSNIDDGCPEVQHAVKLVMMNMAT